MNVFGAFIEALCSVSFYKRVIQQTSLGKGFLYLLLWALLGSSLLSLYAGFRGLPEINEFMTWFKSEIPEITLTVGEGISINKPSPYVMKHSKYGHIATFDTNEKEVTTEKIGEAILFVTSVRLYTRQPARNEVRMYDLTQTSKETLSKGEKILVNEDWIAKIERAVKPILLIVLTVGSFFGFFFWGILAALFYSLVGNLINRMRQQPLPYEKVFTLSIFSMTASLWVNVLLFLLSDLFQVPFGFFGSMILTTLYLAVALKGTEDSEPPVAI